MSDKRVHPKVCGRCARVDEMDLGRKFCPTTATRIYHNKPAGSCRFFVEDECIGGGGRRRRMSDDVLD